jgi:DOMON domain
MQALLSIAICGVLVVRTCLGDCHVNEVWTGSLILNQDASFNLAYRIDHDRIRFKISAANQGGFLAVGFSETGHMLGADVVAIEPLEDGTANLRDLFVPWSASPQLAPMPIDDSCNDWLLHCTTSQGDNREYVISRALDTKDPQDRAIARGTVTNLIYAWGLGRASSGLHYHNEHRGTTAVSFFNDVPSNFFLPADADGHVDIIINNFMLKPKRTTYVLQKFDVGEDTRQVIAYELLIRPEDDVFVHHFLVHDCGANSSSFPLNHILQHFPMDYGRFLCRSEKT